MPEVVKNNFQEYDPRHRLTGAVVLMLLAIILLPMLLSKEQDDATPEVDPVVMEITKEGKKVFVSRITSVAPENTPSVTDENQPLEKANPEERSDSSANKQAVKSGPVDQGPSALFKPMSSTTVSKPPASETDSPAKASSKTPDEKINPQPAASKITTAKKSSTAEAAPASGEWIVQVGVFSQAANAKNKAAELKKKGFDAKTVTMKTSKGTATKVWLGPFNDRSSAEKMQDRLQHKTRQRGMVVKN